MGDAEWRVMREVWSNGRLTSRCQAGRKGSWGSKEKEEQETKAGKRETGQGNRCIRRPKWLEEYACFSGDGKIVLDSHGEAAYNSSSAIRVGWDNNPLQCGIGP